MIMMIMASRFLPLLALFIIIFSCMVITGHSLNSATSKVQCVESEREALLRFKIGFKDPSSSGLFSSWGVEQDCCRWRGVECNNSTGHVITLDLSSSSSRGDQTETFQLGELSASSRLDLPYLSYLDLSRNDFRQIQIPQFIGSLVNLEHLDLSNANFKGTIPDHLGNLSRLQFLDLSGNSFSLKANNLHWLPSLSSLEVLDLGGVDLSSVEDWLDAINMLPSLVDLRLFACQLKKLQPFLPYVNFTSIEILDLSFNSFNSTTPHWLFNISHMSSLVYLNISRSQLQGMIPNAFGKMTSLAVLDLSGNNLEGEIPTILGLSHEAENQVKRSFGLRELYLSHNRLNGSLEQILAQLSHLVVLDVASNSLKGVISEAQLTNFTSLRVLDLSSNSLTFNTSSAGWIPPFQLETIGLRSCQLGPRFPEWLRTQKDFLSLDISNASISGTVPQWFWNLSDKVQQMSLSRNQLRGRLPDFSLKVNLSTLDLSYNSFAGPLPPNFCPRMVSLVLAGNSFSGPISSICEMLVLNNSLSYLDLSGNLLSGEIPDCWTYGQKVVILNLANNNLSGKIPNSIGQLVHLNTLHLENNSLSGELPSSLRNCSSLFVFDIGKNRLSGNIPAWIGEEMQNLMILRLRANAFQGSIPVQLCQLTSLKILDLALNHLSGAIPRCINNFVAMTKKDYARSYIYYPYTAYTESAVVATKGSEYKYNYLRVLVLMMSLDISSNKLSGEIPREITSLIGLRSLNLSRNHLSGTIPDGIGDFEDLESLDLSRNELSCTIPDSLSHIDSLSHLNLSHNRLSGRIPSGHQLDTFDASSYMENHNLCGRPLANRCIHGSDVDPHCNKKERNEANTGTQEDGGDVVQIPSFYISMGLGFITGFWGFLGTLLIKSSWRHAYYRFLGNFYDQIYVIIVVYVARLASKFQNNHVADQ